jgi:hypothetical protein
MGGMGVTPHGRGWGGARRSVGGGGWPVGAQERRSWAGDGSGVPHGRMPTQTGEGKGTDRWAGATLPRFESIQIGQLIQTLFEFKILNLFEL